MFESRVASDHNSLLSDSQRGKPHPIISGGYTVGRAKGDLLAVCQAAVVSDVQCRPGRGIGDTAHFNEALLFIDERGEIHVSCVVIGVAGPENRAFGDDGVEREIRGAFPAVVGPVARIPREEDGLIAVLDDVVEYNARTVIAEEGRDLQFASCEWDERVGLMEGCVEFVQIKGRDFLADGHAAIDVEVRRRVLLAEDGRPNGEEIGIEMVCVGVAEDEMFELVECESVPNEV